MKPWAIIAVACLAATACAPRYVKDPYPVPVPYVPAPPVLERPNVEADHLGDHDFNRMTEAEAAIVVRGYRLSALAWKGYAEQLETVVEFYRDAAVLTGEVRDKIKHSIQQIGGETDAVIRELESIER